MSTATATEVDSRMLRAALWYAERGMPVLPLHTPKNGRCSCGRSDCPNPGKDPRIQGGYENATTEVTTIRGWWSRWPDANIGVVPGRAGLIVFDVDGPEGKASARALGLLAEPTVTTTTSRGVHLFFRHPGGGIGNRFPGVDHIDVRADKGYVIVPPSLHVTGHVYEWLRFDGVAPLPVPPLALAALRNGKKAPKSALPLANSITKGARNNALMSFAGSMRQRGMGEPAILAALREENATRCQPPLHDGELGTIARSAARYPPEATRPAPEHLTDLGNARRLVRLYGARVRYAPARGSWLVFDGRRWAHDETGEVARHAKATVASIYEEAAVTQSGEQRKAIASWATKSESEPRLRALIALAKTEPGIPVTIGELDRDPWVLNVANGTLELRTGTLRPHDPKDLITKLADVAYDVDATASRWQSFLARVFEGDESVITFVQRAVGYTLTGSIIEQIILLLIGTGANGKSVFVETVRACLGDYATATDFATFLVTKHDAVRNDLARLVGARLVTAVEVDQGGRFSEPVIKTITGGDVITARFLFREFFEFQPQFTMLLAANHKPTVRGTEHAIWRRIKLVPFNVTIPPQEQDRHLLAKLREELPGILRWAVEGCLAWQREGLGDPSVVRTATERYRDEMDALAGFLDECVVLKASQRSGASVLYRTYVQWCERVGERSTSQRRFGQRLAERGFTKSRSGSRGQYVWHGLGLAEPPEQSEPFSAYSPIESPTRSKYPKKASVGQLVQYEDAERAAIEQEGQE